MGILGNPDFDDMTLEQLSGFVERLPKDSPLRWHFEDVAGFVEKPPLGENDLGNS